MMYYSTREVARLFRIGQRSIVKDIAAGALPKVRVSVQWRVSADALRRYLKLEPWEPLIVRPWDDQLRVTVDQACRH